jgi:hypothetical protein
MLLSRARIWNPCGSGTTGRRYLQGRAALDAVSAFNGVRFAFTMAWVVRASGHKRAINDYKKTESSCDEPLHLHTLH